MEKLSSRSGSGQIYDRHRAEKMAVAPITQDAVTLAANAALRIIDKEDLEKIDLVIFGTESGIDNSKSGLSTCMICLESRNMPVASN